MRTRTHFKTHFVSLVSGVQSRCLRPFFASSKSQESKSEVVVRKRTRQCALGPILRHTLNLWCLGSNLDVWDHFSHLQNLRYQNLRLSITKQHGPDLVIAVTKLVFLLPTFWCGRTPPVRRCPRLLPCVPAQNFRHFFLLKVGAKIPFHLFSSLLGEFQKPSGNNH